ncbi:hypothetical protein T439DRAFT_358965 [Meredithblackwellia eburnea MCA 4105]
MQFKLLALLNIAAVFNFGVHAQNVTSNSSIPTCVYQCFQTKLAEVNNSTLSPGVNVGNISGLCSTPTFITAFYNCVGDHCNATETATAKVLQNQICLSASSSLTAASSTTSSSTTSGGTAVTITDQSSITSSFGSAFSSLSSSLSADISSSNKSTATATGTTGTSTSTRNAGVPLTPIASGGILGAFMALILAL